jgi:hypothetical protein
LARIRAKRNSGAGPLDFLAGTLEEAENRSSGKYRIPTIYFSEPSPLPVTACAGVVRSWGMSSKTWIARTAEVIADKEVASVVVRLMMALNDIAMANEGLGEWTFGQERKKLARQNGGRLYYGRMLMAHVYEALSIIKDIQDNPKLRALVDACDPETRLSFDAVAVFLTTSDYNMLLRIRNNASFHYDDKLAVRAVEQIDNKFPKHISTYSLGHDPLDWYFQLGDLVLDRIVVRDIFEAPEHADLRAAIDPILLRMHTMANAFSDFSGHFIRNQLKRS